LHRIVGGIAILIRVSKGKSVDWAVLTCLDDEPVELKRHDG
jgi:hypothetical protein